MAMGVWSRGDAQEGTAGSVPCRSPSFSAWPFWASRPSSITRSGRSTTFPGSTAATPASLNPASDPEVYKEYHDKPLAPDMAPKTEMYFFLYFAMTGMHALHMIIGISILGFMICASASRGLHDRARDLCRELRPVLALCRHRLDLPVPAAVFDQQVLRNREQGNERTRANKRARREIRAGSRTRPRTPHRQPGHLSDDSCGAAGVYGAHGLGVVSSTSASGTSLPDSRCSGTRWSRWPLPAPR